MHDCTRLLKTIKTIKDIIGAEQKRVTTRALARRLGDKHPTEVPSLAIARRDSLIPLLSEC